MLGNLRQVNDNEQGNKLPHARLSNCQFQTSYKMTNPLIAMIGISEYEKHILPNLGCTVNDYKNVQLAFYVVRGYSIVYFDKNNQLKHKKRATLTNKNINIDRHVASRNDLKLRWNENDIFDYNNQVHNILKNKKYNHDGLIYFVSCHGDTDNVIYDSNGNKIPLIVIFDKFNNQNCIQLRNKPKIYFVDACRGNRRTQRIKNSMFGHDQQMEKLNVSNSQNYTHNGSNLERQTSATMGSSGNLQTIDNKNSNVNTNAIFSKYNYNREIYANTEGYAVVEPDSLGAYMTRSITKAIENDDIFKKDFNTIMIHTRKIMTKLMGTSVQCAAQVIEDHNSIPPTVFFG